MISFEPQVGKAQTGQTSSRFTVIIPKINNGANALQTCVLQYVIYNWKTTRSQICWNVGDRNVSKNFVPVTC